MARTLEILLQQAVAKRAGSLLLVPGQPPVCRVGRVLQPPLDLDAVTPEETCAIAEPLLSEAMSAALRANGSVERPFLLGEASGQVTIFLGQGNYHLVFYLDPLI